MLAFLKKAKMPTISMIEPKNIISEEGGSVLFSEPLESTISTWLLSNNLKIS